MERQRWMFVMGSRRFLASLIRFLVQISALYQFSRLKTEQEVFGIKEAVYIHS
jgi:hypothetical protein